MEIMLSKLFMPILVGIGKFVFGGYMGLTVAMLCLSNVILVIRQTHIDKFEKGLFL